MTLPVMVQKAVETLCARFERADYEPTPVIDLGTLVAQADGTIDPQEVHALCELMGSSLGEQLDDELVGYLVDASLEVIRAAGVDARVRLVAAILQDSGAVEEGITVALGVAFASDGLAAPERAVIESLARAAEYPQSQLDALVGRVERAFEGVSKS